MKNIVRTLLQKTLGFEQYLFLFSMYSIRRFENGGYEKEFRHFIDITPNQGVILDIGANIGITVAPLARYLSRAEIHAYEPIPESFDALKKVINILKFENVRLFNFALGNDAGELPMVMPLNGKARMQGLSKAYTGALEETGTTYKVPLDKLDNIYLNRSDIAAMKIDVENFELEVLLGGVEVIKKNHPIIYCELWDNPNRPAVFDLLHALGYCRYTFLEEYKMLVDLEKNNIPPRSNNFFFIHSDNREELNS